MDLDALPPPPLDHRARTAAGPRFRSGARDPGPSTKSQVWFHLGGAVLTVGAAVVSFAALALVSFGTSTCSQDVTDPELVNDLRLGIVIVALAGASVPGLWALLARAGRYAWVPWAAVASTAIGGGVLFAATVDEVAYWCLF